MTAGWQTDYRHQLATSRDVPDIQYYPTRYLLSSIRQKLSGLLTLCCKHERDVQDINEGNDTAVKCY